MSMMFYVQDDLPLTRRQARGRLFGSCIEATREAGGRSGPSGALAAGTHDSYTHPQRKEVRPIKKKEETGVKRVNINVPIALHNSFKSTTAAQGVDMTTILLSFIESYVAKYESAPKPKSRRA